MKLHRELAVDTEELVREESFLWSAAVSCTEAWLQLEPNCMKKSSWGNRVRNSLRRFSGAENDVDAS